MKTIAIRLLSENAKNNAFKLHNNNIIKPPGIIRVYARAYGSGHQLKMVKFAGGSDAPERAATEKGLSDGGWMRILWAYEGGGRLQYRLVRNGELIQRGDEVLLDDCVTWMPVEDDGITRAFIDRLEWHYRLMPMRRPVFEQ